MGEEYAEARSGFDRYDDTGEGEVLCHERGYLRQPIQGKRRGMVGEIQAEEQSTRQRARAV